MADIIRGYIPGAIGRIAELHGTYYSRYWSFGLFFEAKVTTGLCEFLQRYDETRDGIWLVTNDERVEGSIVIDGIHAQEKGAHLRWFILSDMLRGMGYGKRLMQTALAFCREKGYRRVHLSTFEGLLAARHLYEKSGFNLVEQHRGAQWGTEVNEQEFELVM